jgi:glycosyltransferase involved in cell wall biosynthesis
MRIFWAKDFFESGGAFGYSIHNKRLKEALLAAGAEITLDPTTGADIAVHITTPPLFKPVAGMKNLLFYQVECSEPTEWSETVKDADILVTSSRHGKAVLSKYFKGPVEVCPLGVNAEHFPFYQRKAPDTSKPYRVLFVGNMDGERKGGQVLPLILQAWKRMGGASAGAILHLKDSGRPGGSLMRYPDGTYYDTRLLSTADMAGLYNSSAVFILPTGGEGWGMTLTEAMATGCPSIWTAWSAMPDYADAETGYPISTFTMDPCYKGDRLFAYSAAPDPAAIVGSLQAIFADYPEALRRGRAASERMHSKYTWACAAKRFIEICDSFSFLNA